MHLSYPSVIIPILYERTSASSMEWVVKMIALFSLQAKNIKISNNFTLQDIPYASSIFGV